MTNIETVSPNKKEVIRNLYLSGIGEEFIAMQLDLEIPIVIESATELDVTDDNARYVLSLLSDLNKQK